MKLLFSIDINRWDFISFNEKIMQRFHLYIFIFMNIKVLINSISVILHYHI